MQIAFFAARQLHRDYFGKVSQYLNAEHHQSQVLWHKDLWKTPRWLTHLSSSTSQDHQDALKDIIQDHLKEKQNSRKGRLRSATYWKTFATIKRIEVLLLFAVYRHALKQAKVKRLVIWNGLKYRQRIVIAAADSLHIKMLYMENGLLPGMTTLDAQGINYRNSVPRDIVAFQHLKPLELSELNQNLTTQFADRPSHLPDDYIFVPFQVNTDSQVVLFSPWIKDMFGLVETFEQVADQLDEQMPPVVFKPHPACDESYDDVIDRFKAHKHLQFDTDTPTAVLIQHAAAVATINSTVGIESLLLDKKLLVLGQAFYAYPSLCLTANSQEQLKQALLKLPGWQTNQEHSRQLFRYLFNDYQVAGRWQEADEHHIQACAARLLEMAS